jgi:hypothetical protein
MAKTAVVDPNAIAISGFDSSSDPVADALGAEPRELVQHFDLSWCAWFEVSQLASSRSLYFEVAPNGAVVDTESC